MCPMNITPPKLRVLRILSKSQLGLFDKPVQVQGSVDKHGTYRQPHTRIMLVRPQQGGLFDTPAAARQPEPTAHAGKTGSASGKKRLATFIERHGGPRALARNLGELPAAQREHVIAGMASLGGISEGEIRTMLEAFGPPRSPSAPASVAAPARAPQPAPLAPRDEGAIASTITQRAQTIANNADAAARRATAQAPQRLAGALRAEAARLTDGAVLMPNEELRQSNLQAAQMLRLAAERQGASGVDSSN